VAQKIEIAEEDKLIDANFILQTGLFRSRASIYAAEAAGQIPVSMKIGAARRWRLKSWRAHFEQLETAANANSALA
jgi:hypothetical protein